MLQINDPSFGNSLPQGFFDEFDEHKFFDHEPFLYSGADMQVPKLAFDVPKPGMLWNSIHEFKDVPNVPQSTEQELRSAEHVREETSSFVPSSREEYHPYHVED